MTHINEGINQVSELLQMPNDVEQSSDVFVPQPESVIAPKTVFDQLGISEGEYMSLLLERDRRRLENLKDVFRLRGYSVLDNGHGKYHVRRGSFDHVAHGYDELRATAVQRGVVLG